MKIDPKNFYAYKMELFKKIAGLKILLSIPKTLTDLKKKKKKIMWVQALPHRNGKSVISYLTVQELWAPSFPSLRHDCA